MANRSALARLLTKPLWWWETKRPYPIVDRIMGMEPISVSSPLCKLGVLTTPDKVLEAAWTSYSILKQIPAGLELVMVVDQSKPVEEIPWLQQLFPDVELISTAQLVERARSRLPNTCRLADRYPLGRKLVMILELQRENAILYSDSDVLAFGAMQEIAEAIGSLKDAPLLYLQDVCGVQLDPVAKRRVDALGLDLAPTLNTGFLFVPKSCLPYDITEEILASGQDGTSWFTETTVMAALVRAAGGVPLPRENFVVSMRRQFIGEADFDYDAISLRHFVSPVRHLMYKNAMPHLLRKWRFPM